MDIIVLGKVTYRTSLIRMGHSRTERTVTRPINVSAMMSHAPNNHNLRMRKN